MEVEANSLISKTPLTACKISLLCLCNDFFEYELDKVNSDAARLHIKPFRFNKSLTLDECTGHESAEHAAIYSYLKNSLRQDIKDPDIFEAFEVGLDIFVLSEMRGNGYFNYYSISQSTLAFIIYRESLIMHLRSLNLVEIIDQIPTNEKESWGAWGLDLASLRGLIRKNYPTVYVSQ